MPCYKYSDVYENGSLKPEFVGKTLTQFATEADCLNSNCPTTTTTTTAAPCDPCSWCMFNDNGNTAYSRLITLQDIQNCSARSADGGKDGTPVSGRCCEDVCKSPAELGPGGICPSTTTTTTTTTTTAAPFCPGDVGYGFCKFVSPVDPNSFSCSANSNQFSRDYCTESGYIVVDCPDYIAQCGNP